MGTATVLLLWGVAGTALGLSYLGNPARTRRAVQISWRKLLAILPAFMEMLIIVSLTLTLIPQETIVRYAGGKGVVPMLLGASLGSILMMPGFVAFPLAGILLSRGASYMTIAAFTTTLMMVGFVTFSVESRYLGFRAALLRNVFQGLGIAMAVALAVGIAFGELM